jgi:3-hydroxyisobutyrate dehydrogenase-like beta-hydroxyacid dehydrogenase
MTTIGLLNPGDMGSKVGAAVRSAGSRVLWAGEGRSADTRKRALEGGLEDVGTVVALVRASDVILSVCPPHAAVDVAKEVAGLRFAGTFVDGNAVSPATAREIGGIVEKGGATFVDGGIIGPPPRAAGSTRLYLSGREAKRAVALFEGSALEAIAVNDVPGAASALKMVYAAVTKGTSALLMGVRALASREGVDEALLAEWRRSQPDLPKKSEAAARDNARKAWRFVGEMDEIAATFEAAGLPDGFHRAAGEIYRRLADYKDVATPPAMTDLVAPLTRPAGSRPPTAATP